MMRRRRPIRPNIKFHLRKRRRFLTIRSMSIFTTLTTPTMSIAILLSGSQNKVIY